MTKEQYKQEIFNRFRDSEKYYYNFTDVLSEVVNWIEDIEPYKFDMTAEIYKNANGIYYEWKIK